jgi:UDP-N-acetylmuramyl pentapeptide phosphotransferase/UDP-N-acetylglucosamine-1-phosphate transferase
MTETTARNLIWIAGCIHVGIVLANVPLPGMLEVRKHLVNVPRFIKQVFYVHWFYIVLIVSFFAALCFGFAHDLAGASPLGRFLSAFMAGFWLLRIALQWLYYDYSLLRRHRLLYLTYTVALIALVGIFGMLALYPRA